MGILRGLAVVWVALLAPMGCSSGSGGGGGGTGATSLQPFCSKCAECLNQDPTFSEGFCDPFWNGSTFDVGSCTQNGDVSNIDTPSLTAGQISAMSCSDFDSAI